MLDIVIARTTWIIASIPTHCQTWRDSVTLTLTLGGGQFSYMLLCEEFAVHDEIKVTDDGDRQLV